MRKNVLFGGYKMFFDECDQDDDVRHIGLPSGVVVNLFGGTLPFSAPIYWGYAPAPSPMKPASFGGTPSHLNNLWGYGVPPRSETTQHWAYRISDTEFTG